MVYWGIEHQDSLMISVSARAVKPKDVIEAKLKYVEAYVLKVIGNTESDTKVRLAERVAAT
jgi:hypothetical protein